VVGTRDPSGAPRTIWFGRVDGYDDLDVLMRRYAVSSWVIDAAPEEHELRVAQDLWGGLADPRTGRPWTPSTPAVVFSSTKGVLAIGAYLLVQEGRLDLTPRWSATGPGSARRAKPRSQ
jgi:hypothetical protein